MSQTHSNNKATGESAASRVTFSHYTDPVCGKATYQKVNNKWHLIVSWNPGQRPVISRPTVEAPYVIDVLEQNQLTIWEAAQ
jgi:hypothetical protein